MNTIVLGTGNKHKVIEIKEILKGTKLNILTFDDFKKKPRIIENGKTLKENAVIKAKKVSSYYKAWALADDSGLEVKYLKGEPGVYSARWAGRGCTYQDNNKKLLRKLKDIPLYKRKAKFKTVIALTSPNGKSWTVEGSIEGKIGFSLKGKNGFGYDPLFVPEGFKKTFAELSSFTKNRISHRSNALKKMNKLINKVLNN